MSDPIAALAKRVESAAFGLQAQREFFATPTEFLVLREALRIAERVDFKLTPDQALIDARDMYREYKERLA